MKGLNYLVPVEGEQTILIMLSSASFFYRASNVIINGGIFSIIQGDGNAVIRQTGERIYPNLQSGRY